MLPSALMISTRRAPRLCSRLSSVVGLALAVLGQALAVAGESIKLATELREQVSRYCSDCHSTAEAEARLDLQASASEPVADHFSDWRRVVRAVAEQRMPPPDAPQISVEQRQTFLAELESAIRRTAEVHSVDPGPTVIRRLTSAEYDYCIEDLTGLRLELGQQFIGDSVGGSGFTNSAAAQFMQDATLERYLDAAKVVADHAMLGTGPIYFYPDPGQTGLELSAAERVKGIYRQYGFRSSAGEGAEPFGLECIPQAVEVAWRYRHRKALQQDKQTLAAVASAMGVEPKFALHIWNVLHQQNASFPLSDVIAAWDALPTPQQIAENLDHEIARHAQELYLRLERWQTRFAGSASAEEEAAVLTVRGVDVPESAQFVARALRKRIVHDASFTPDINNADLYSSDGLVRFQISIEPASSSSQRMPAVIFRNPEFRFRVTDVVQPAPVSLRSLLSSQSIADLEFGQNPGGVQVGEQDFVLRVGQSRIIEVELPEDCRIGELRLSASLDTQSGRDSVVRCVVQDVTGEQGRTFSSLLRDPSSSSMDRWEAGLSEFARALPQISNREPVPSDRDPIPQPYNNVYNLPERNYFHTAVKYYRDDDFLIEHVIPESVGLELDRAWADLLTSFDYHHVNLRFTTEKYGVELGQRRIESLDSDWIARLPAEPQQHIARFKSQYDAMHQALKAAEPQHLQDVLSFATAAWRQPLSTMQRDELQEFYHQARGPQALSHRAAIRATLVRILMSPEFLFRVEQPGHMESAQPLAGHELANRLSFSIWSSMPDSELSLAASDGSLIEDQVLESQTRRLLRSPKARRLSTEFFGQWFGFYQFDRYRGVDSTKFPEFDEPLRAALYDEAISLFEHMVREDRPYTEILNADYILVDRRAAEHYGLAWDGPDDARRMFANASQFQRGGVFGLAAVLTATSAPLRTSPVKRGDWILRRILGTPVPPPPADAGSIPADDVLADGKTVRERLEAHRNNPSCTHCHQRIDPLGFALENYDSLGRWRDTYRDGLAIDASSVLSNGQAICGLEGLKSFLAETAPLFRRTFATKLVAYFLGRAETVADARLIDTIVAELEMDPRISTAVITIVRSPQFRQARGSNGDIVREITVATPN